MDEVSLEFSVTPIDLLKCLTEIYKTNRYTDVELAKLAEESRRFDKEYLAKTERYEVKKEEILKLIGLYQKVLEKLTAKVVENPSCVSSKCMETIKFCTVANIKLIDLLEKVD